MSLTDAQCQEIADWSIGLRIPGVPDVRLVATYDCGPGSPELDGERRELRLHWEDARDLRRWADRRSRDWNPYSPELR